MTRELIFRARGRSLDNGKERIIEAEEERDCVASLAKEAEGRGEGGVSCVSNREASGAQGVTSDGFYRHA